MKFLILVLFSLFASLSFAVERENVTNDEIQKELDSASDKIVFDQEDQEFLDSHDQATVKVEKKDGVVWGKVVEPVKKAEAPTNKPIKK